MFVNNTAYFLLIVFSGASSPLTDLPRWMQSISWGLCLLGGFSQPGASSPGRAYAG